MRSMANRLLALKENPEPVTAHAAARARQFAN